MEYVAAFFAGALLSTSIPHLTAGLQGAPFQTLFATPRGVGQSSPLVNVLWGAANLLIGLILLAWHPVTIGFNGGFIAIGLGALLVGVFAALHFGRINAPKK